MNSVITHLFTNWKSTLQSILTTTFAVTGALMLSSVIKPHTAAILTAINGVCKVVLGVFQTDGTAIPPGSTLKQTSTLTTPAEGAK